MPGECHLVVEAGGRTFAIEGSHVAAVTRYDDAVGVELLDLNTLLGGEPAAPGPRTCVVVVNVSEPDVDQAFGLVVDAASDVVTFHPGEVVEPPDFGPRVSLPYLSALARRGETFAIILDVERLLARVAAKRGAA